MEEKVKEKGQEGAKDGRREGGGAMGQQKREGQEEKKEKQEKKGGREKVSHAQKVKKKCWTQQQTDNRHRQHLRCRTSCGMEWCGMLCMLCMLCVYLPPLCLCAWTGVSEKAGTIG